MEALDVGLPVKEEKVFDETWCASVGDHAGLDGSVFVVEKKAAARLLKELLLDARNMRKNVDRQHQLWL